MKSLKLIIMLLFASLLGLSQNITRMEYFVDTDPGYGNGISIPFSGTEIAEADFTVPLNGLDNGLHFLYLRAQNQSGDWSMTSFHHILKDVFQSEDAVIDHAEYYIDNDPGFGNGTAISVSSGKIVDVAFNLDISGLDNGLHILNIRVRTNNGAWSLTHTHHILTDVFQSADAEISGIEYFFDTDPGTGNGTSVSVTAAKVVDVTFQADLAGLSPGLHFLYVRALTNDNTWGNLHLHPIFVDVLGTADSEITEVEYYIDTDPGFGNATSVDVLPGKVVELAFEIDLDDVDPGFHFISVRSKSDNNLWSLSYNQLFLLDVLDSDEDPIAYVEYFLDEDPGIGNATEVPITPGKVVELAFEVDLENVEPGFHFVNVRSQSENGTWSHAYTQLFLLDVLDSGDEPITYVEYFLDEDPGIGNAIEVPITPGNVVELAFEIDLENIDPGFHFVNIRSQSENGTWSHAYTQLFLLDQLDSGDEPITYVEYFLDEDPGIGNATEVPIAPGKVVELAFEIDLESVEPGFHFVNVRSQSENGTWSHSFYQILYVDVLQSSNATCITYVEYFMDEDPGYGQGIPVDIIPASLVDVNIMPDISALENGFHTFVVRAKDEDGIWSASLIQLFYLENVGDIAPNLVSLEYFMDEDPGFGNGSALAINPPSPVADQDFVVQLGSVEPGEHILYMRAIDEFNNWSIVAYDTVFVEVGSEFALSFDGENDFLEAGDFQFPENDLTLEAWIHPDVITGIQEILFAFGENAGVQLRLNADGSLLYGELAGANWNYVLSEPASILPNRWTHVAMSKDDAVCTLYINGYFAAISQFDNNPVTHTLDIGGRSTAMDRFFNGDIDEVRIWETARSQQEIRDNMCGAFSGSETGMYGLWHFSEGSGSSVAADSGPNVFGAWLYNMNVDPGPECSWIDHSCALPASVDLAILSISSPKDLIWNEQGENNTVSVLIKNYGIEDLDGDIDFSFTLDNGTPVEESQNLSIAAGASVMLDFASHIDLSAIGNHNIEVSIAVSGDTYPENNTMTKSIETVEIGRKAYAYNAWSNQSGLQNGPVVFDLNQPGHVFSLADQSSLQNLDGATWVNDKWYGITGDSIFILDTVTGERTFISLQDNFITSLAWDETTAKLFGLSWVSLYEIDPASGSATYVGYTGLDGFTAMACDGDGNLFALNVEDDQIYHINKETAAADVIGPVGFNALYQQDMEYDPVNDVIYLAAFNEDVHQGELRTVDLNDGSTYFLGTFRGGMELAGFVIPSAEIIPPPVAVFDGNPQSGFAPLEVQFTDLSEGEIDSWYWEFGDGNFSVEQNPVYEYVNPGTYTVSLTVSNNSGSGTEVMEAFIQVDPATIYDLQFTHNPGSEGTYPSEFAGQEVSVTGIVTATGYNGQDNAFFISEPEGGPWKSIYIYNGSLGVQMGDEVVIDGQVVEYYGMTEILNPQVSILSSGNPIPSPFVVTTGSIIYPETAEQWESTIVTILNPIVTQMPNAQNEWYVDDGSGECQVDDRIYQYVPFLGEQFGAITGAVDYSFNQYGLNPRMEADLVSVILEADFAATPVIGFIPLSVDFSDISIGAPDQWLWDFGDGQTSTEKNPTHVYETFGIYDVSLTIYKNGNEDTEIKVGFIEVYQTQNGDWNLQHLCLENTPEAELMIRAGDIDNLGFGWPDGFDPFTGESTPSHGYPWTADPGDTGGTDRIMVVTSFSGNVVPCGVDGYTSNTSRPENLPEPVIIDLCQLSSGSINSAALQIFVDDIQPESFCSGFTVKLNGNTLSSLQTIVNRIDQSGPIGRMLTVRIPDELLYLLEGEQLELEIDDFTTGAGDGFAIDFVKLLINEGELTHSGSIAGSVFDASTSLPIEGAEVEASFWETALTVSDGSYSIGEAPAGLVYVECRKSGYQTETTLLNLASGDALNADFWLNPVLMADFNASPLSGQVPLEVQFTDLSSGNPVSWWWDFGDGSTSDFQNPSHLFTNPGFYTVSLTISDGNEQDDITKVNYIHVNSPATGNWLAEYFFDSDPGYGNAIPIYGNGEDDVMITFNAPVNHLSDGLHTFYSRSKNENGSWSQTMSRPFLKEYLPKDANPDIAYLEYFFDVDPGFGQGISIVVYGLSPMEIAVNLPLETMEYGMHTLYVRSKDENGRWSIVMQRTFIMGNYPADPLKALVKAEYFIDKDPGQGLAKPVLFDPNNGIHQQEFDANLDGYEWGEHMLYMRTMDESGSWSITVAEPFTVEEPPIIAEFSADITAGSVPLSVQFTDETYVSEPTEWLWNFGDGEQSTAQNPQHTFADPGTYTVSLTATNDEGTNTEVKENYITVYPPIYSLEYFFDVDPGYGNATGVYAYSSNLGGFDFLIPLEELSDGYHLLFVRVKDTSSVWTQTMTRSFLKTRLMSDPDPDISKMEYFVDEDPGFGQASSIPVSQSPVPVVETLIPLDGYADGLHNIFIRSQDENGRWSETMIRPFLKSYVPGGLANVSGLEYFIDEDPGVGNGTSVSVPNPQANVERSFVVNLGAQTPGEHRLFVRAIDSRGHWSIVYNQLIEVTATGAVQVVQLPEGWSGISSYIIPDDGAVENIFSSIEDELVILQNFDGMYWPTAGVNTLSNWDDQAGYQVKMETAQQVTFSGNMQDNLTANLSAGWNYLPVLNACSNEADNLFTQISGNLQIVKEVAGTGVYWPQFGVNTLGDIVPGKAYFVLVDEDVEVAFPACTPSDTKRTPSNSLADKTPSNSPSRGRIDPASEKRTDKNDQSDNSDIRSSVAASCVATPSPPGEGWGEVIKTPLTHTIAIPLQVISGLNEENIITIYNQSGFCCAAAVFQNQNIVITAFGDDPTTPQIDGMIEGEPLQFRIFNPETGKEFPLTIEFDSQMPQGGYFVNHGLSAVKDLQVTGLDENQDLGINISIYPNPSTDIFNIHFGNTSKTVNWEVTDIHGSIIALSNDQFRDFAIDISSHPKGIYYLKITKGGLQMVRKLVLQ